MKDKKYTFTVGFWKWKLAYNQPKIHQCMNGNPICKMSFIEGREFHQVATGIDVIGEHVNCIKCLRRIGVGDF